MATGYLLLEGAPIVDTVTAAAGHAAGIGVAYQAAGVVPVVNAPAGLAAGTGSALQAATSVGTSSPRPDIANAPAASDLVLWVGLSIIDGLTDAQFIDLRDNFGITTIGVGRGYMYTMGGGSRFNAPANATFNSADGRTGTEWNAARSIKYGNAGVGTSGNGNLVTRVHALGMKIYLGTRWFNLSNTATPLVDWFDDTAWTTLLNPTTGPLAEHINYAKAWGFDGVTMDDEPIGFPPDPAPQPTWKYNYAGNGQNQATTRAKVKQRGTEIGALFTALWPDMDIFEYNTTGTGGFPDDWDEDFKQLVNDPTGNIKELSTQRDMWDGVFSVAGFTGNLRFLSSTFYKAPGSGATWFGAEQYNAVRQLARLSRTWTNWDLAHDRFFINPFHWPGRAANQAGGEDFPMSLATIQAAFAGSRIMGMGHIGFYTQTYTEDNIYFTPAMDAVFQAANDPGTVNTVVPTLSAITQTGRSGNNIDLAGTATHPLGIRYVEWEVYNAAGTAIETTGAFGHSFVPGAGNHQSATGFADATYPFDVTVDAPVGRKVRVTAVSIKDQSHSTEITMTGTGYPDATNTGVLGASLTTINLSGTSWRTSVEGASGFTTEVIGPNTYKVYTAKNFVATTQYVYCDDPYVKFKTCRFTASGAVNNGMAVIQQSSGSLAVIWEDCTVDGGAAFHNRGISGDYGDFTILRGNFTRCGEAAVEKNDRDGLFSMYVTDSYITQVKGWPGGQHVDGLQMDGGKNFTAQHNTIWIEPYGGTDGDTGYVSNSCIGVWSTLAAMTGNILIENNQLAGGGSVVYMEQQSFSMLGTVTVNNNRFDRAHFPSLQGAQYNPTSGHAAVWYVLYPGGRPASLSGAGSGWTNNKWEDGTTVTLAVAITST